MITQSFRMPSPQENTVFKRMGKTRLQTNFSGYHTTRKNASVTAAIICGQKTCQLGLCSHVNDIVPLSYRSDFWNDIVDCVYTNSV